MGRPRPERLIHLPKVTQPVSIRPRLESRSPGSQLEYFPQLRHRLLKTFCKVKVPTQLNLDLGRKASLFSFLKWRKGKEWTEYHVPQALGSLGRRSSQSKQVSD